MISTVIVSKDRPAQLRLLLDSLQINGGNLFDITVIYEYSDDLFFQGYVKTQNYFYNKHLYNVNFPIKWKVRKHANLSNDILECLNDSRDLFCMFNDENILFNRVASFKLINQLFKSHVLSSLSLRLGNNTVVQNPYEEEAFFAPIPSEGEFVFDRFLVWDASTIKKYTNFGMPFSTNGHIYHKNVISNALKRTDIVEIDDFEVRLQDNLYNGIFEATIPSLMSCPEYSCVIHNSSTKLTETEESNLDISIETINARYLKGNIIDYKFFDFSGVSKPYQEFIMGFRNENNMHHSS